MDITSMSDTHNYYTRNSRLHFILCTGNHGNVKSQGRLGFLFNGIKLWNKLTEIVPTKPCKHAKHIFQRRVNMVEAHYLNEMGALESERFIFH